MDAWMACFALPIEVIHIFILRTLIGRADGNLISSLRGRLRIIKRKIFPLWLTRHIAFGRDFTAVR